MKKIVAVTVMLLLLLGLCGVTALAESTVKVYVSIAGKDGNAALSMEAVAVSDIDGDGALTIHDALYAAHEAKYEGGAAAGYAASASEYGLSMDKLWGAANGSSYGYYLNDASPQSLADAVKDGDHVSAFVYTDLTAWSDTYCYFDVKTAEGKVGDTLTLTLFAAGYDAAYNPVTLPVEGAIITVDGEATAYVTDADGKVTLSLQKEGTCVISATSDTQTLVPPTCKVLVSATAATPDTDEEVSSPATGEASVAWVCGVSVAAFVLAVLACACRKHAYEN